MDGIILEIQVATSFMSWSRAMALESFLCMVIISFENQQVVLRNT